MCDGVITQGLMCVYISWEITIAIKEAYLNPFRLDAAWSFTNI